jgi:hypothetical protein
MDQEGKAVRASGIAQFLLSSGATVSARALDNGPDMVLGRARHLTLLTLS